MVLVGSSLFNCYPRTFPEDPSVRQKIKGVNAQKADPEGTGWRQSNFSRRAFPVAAVRSILARQDYRCNNCLDSFDFLNVRYTIDHLVPLSLGGDDKSSNLQALCWQCHGFKYVLSLGEWNRIKAAVARLASASRLLFLHYRPIVWESYREINHNREKRVPWSSSYFDRVREAWRTRPEMLRRKALEKAVFDSDERAVLDGLLCPDALWSGRQGTACPYLVFDGRGFVANSFVEHARYKPDARYFLKALTLGE